MYNLLKKLEAKYEKARRESDPKAAGKIHAKMDKARERIEYLESMEG